MAVDWKSDVLRMVADFGETVTYKKFAGLSTNGGFFAERYFDRQYWANRYFAHGAGASAPDPRDITAIVDRRIESFDTDDHHLSMAPLLEVTVSTDPASGIPPEELDTGGDRIAVSARVGETAIDHKILRVIEHDPQGYMRMELR